MKHQRDRESSSGLRWLGAAHLAYGGVVAVLGGLVCFAPLLAVKLFGVVPGYDVVAAALETGPAGWVTYGLIPFTAGAALISAGLHWRTRPNESRALACVAAAVLIGNRLAWAVAVGSGAAGIAPGGLAAAALMACAYPLSALVLMAPGRATVRRVMEHKRKSAATA